MKTVLVFAGTTEGRELVEAFDRSGISCHVCVATEYGSQLLKTSDNIIIHEGRLDEEGMRKLYEEIDCDVVVDATHPFAVVVTELILKSLESTDITYIRLQRGIEKQSDMEQIHLYDSVEECAAKLADLSGRILLTTGSKQLAQFTAVAGVKDRIIARVIPGIESLELCYEAGLEGNQIIAMQGPFSTKMNETLIREYNIEHLVTKESGVTGGVDSKIQAAKNLGITLHMIKKPEEISKRANQEGYSTAEVIDKLEQLLEVSFNKGGMEIVLAGIGPGSTGLMTKEAKEAIKNADVIFGAQRMIDSANSKAKKYPYYLKEDILPILNELKEQKYTDTRVVVLFSGDTGFYSGCRKMYESLAANSKWSVKVLPGISSISVLCSKFGIDWQEGEMVSLHGTDKEQWIPRILEGISHNEKTFFIASGVKDVCMLGELLSGKNDDCIVKLGYRLSYEDEKILTLSPKECTELQEEGLYCGVIISKNIEARYLVPTLSDEFFIRENVPMTKEEVRKLSICQMNIKENDIVYDIGSGSGSIAVQIGALSSSVKVYALECKLEAVELINKNVKKANLYNVTVLEAMAPKGLDGLPVANVAFIGGSKGNLKDILYCLYDINPSMRIVMNAVSMETICEMNQILKTMNIDNLSIEQISVSKARKLGDYNMLSANNPVFVFSFDFVKKAE